MSKICCFTGHRKLSSSVLKLTPHLETAIRRLVAIGYTDFRTGGAIGFDTLAALVVLKVREDNPHIRLHLILPHPNHESGFSKLEKELFKATVDMADTVTYTSKRTNRSSYYIRNRALVDGSDYCISYSNSPKGGTAYTVRYAKKKGVPVYNVVRRK